MQLGDTSIGGLETVCMHSARQDKAKSSTTTSQRRIDSANPSLIVYQAVLGSPSQFAFSEPSPHPHTTRVINRRSASDSPSTSTPLSLLRDSTVLSFYFPTTAHYSLNHPHNQHHLRPQPHHQIPHNSPSLATWAKIATSVATQAPPSNSEAILTTANPAP